MSPLLHHSAIRVHEHSPPESPPPTSRKAYGSESSDRSSSKSPMHLVSSSSDFTTSGECSSRDRHEGLSRAGKGKESDRVHRMRERNRMHARKTRLRKKLQMKELQGRIDRLKWEGGILRQHIFDRYTANVLLIMSGKGPDTQLSKLEEVINREGINRLLYAASTLAPRLEMTSEGKLKETGMRLPGDAKDGKPKRRGKYTPEERDRVRRERNRMHAKRTRDRKKIFLEESENLIMKMEDENRQMRRYLSQSGLELPDDLQQTPSIKRSASESALLILNKEFGDSRDVQSCHTSNTSEEALSESSQEGRDDMMMLLVATQT